MGMRAAHSSLRQVRIEAGTAHVQSPDHEPERNKTWLSPHNPSKKACCMCPRAGTLPTRPWRPPSEAGAMVSTL
eukprot:366433-Chlamydomonas_euryale.AAC.18